MIKKLRTLSDEGLGTQLLEIQVMLTLRPLTRANCDSDDLKVLCPQNILTGTVESISRPDVLVCSDGLRVSYRLSQAYAEEFCRICNE